MNYLILAGLALIGLGVFQETKKKSSTGTPPKQTPTPKEPDPTDPLPPVA